MCWISYYCRAWIFSIYFFSRSIIPASEGILSVEAPAGVYRVCTLRSLQPSLTICILSSIKILSFSYLLASFLLQWRSITAFDTFAPNFSLMSSYVLMTNSVGKIPCLSHASSDRGVRFGAFRRLGSNKSRLICFDILFNQNF